MLFQRIIISKLCRTFSTFICIKFLYITGLFFLYNNISRIRKIRLDIIPTSIALAQAAKESGWGTSRFALEGNAIFGQWTWNGKGIEPLLKDKNLIL